MIAQQIITQHLDIWTAAHKTRSSAGRGSSTKLDLYGIKKLRELILELAVRGKLVPQDSSDEPASALFNRIHAEKQRLLVESKTRKQKELTADALPEAPENRTYGSRRQYSSFPGWICPASGTCRAQ